MRSRFATSVALATLAFVALGCEGTATGVLTTGATGSVRVRLLNAITSAQAVDFGVDGQVATSGIGFGGASPYVSMSVGSHRLMAQASGTGTTLVDFTRDLTDGSFSFIPAPGLGQFGALFIPDDPTPAPGQAKLRVVHVAAAGPTVISVFLTSPSADLGSSTPIIPTLLFPTASDYVVVSPGTYRIRVTAVTATGTVLLDIPSISLPAGTVRTVLVTDSPGGGLPSTASVVADN